MHCWPNRFQEPYVMVKRRDNITDYLEDLINYGFNKITYIENLRYRGYRFIIAGEMFAFDLPHHPYVCEKDRSIFNAIHKRYVYNANLPAYHSYMNIVRKHTNSSMLVLCDSLKNRTNVWSCLLTKKWNSRRHIPLCTGVGNHLPWKRNRERLYHRNTSHLCVKIFKRKVKKLSRRRNWGEQIISMSLPKLNKWNILIYLAMRMD